MPVLARDRVAAATQSRHVHLRHHDWLHHVVTFVVLGAFLWMGAVESLKFQMLMEEDGWAEWGTFLAFLLAGVLSLAGAVRGEGRGSDRLALAGLGLFCVFVAGEEISWGQRLLGFRPPDMFLEHNYQQEANLHNLLNEIFEVRWMILLIAVAYGLLAFALGRWTRLPSALSPHVSIVPWFVMIAALTIHYPYAYSGELLELILGLLFLADVIERRGRVGITSKLLTAGVVQLWVLAGAVTLVPVASAITQRHAQNFVPAALEEMHGLRAALRVSGVLRPELLEQAGVHKRFYTAIEKGYLAMPRDSHFLDPWNQSYWILYARRSETRGRILIYSYGPNRRRDSNVPTLLHSIGSSENALRQDDLGVTLDVTFTNR